MENQITKIVQTVELGQIYNLEEVIREFLENIGNVYSYIVYINYKAENIENWSVQYNVSQISKFNTIEPETIINKVSNIIRDSYINFQKLNIKYVIGYEQPSIDLILRLYNPFVKSLARKQHEKWQHLSYEDLCQDCRLVICMLYNKGYYIHKRLVEKSFNNLVLMSLRKDIDKPQIISLEDSFNQLSGETELMIKDIIPDTKLLEKEYDDERSEIEQNMFKELKELIIEEIGQRGFEQLLKSYGSKMTDEWSRSTIFKLKRKFQKEGIYELLKKKYN